MATLDSQADYRAVLAAVNALGTNQRDHRVRLTSVETRLSTIETRARFGSVDEQLAEIEDLIINRRTGL